MLEKHRNIEMKKNAISTGNTVNNLQLLVFKIKINFIKNCNKTGKVKFFCNKIS